MTPREGSGQEPPPRFGSEQLLAHLHCPIVVLDLLVMTSWRSGCRPLKGPKTGSIPLTYWVHVGRDFGMSVRARSRASR